MKLDTLKARIGRSDYEVDPHAVAEAIVRRLMAGRVESVPGSDGHGPSLPGPPQAA
ncbi:MAG TPA: hypothetical protein VNB64_10535 [Solirubrobacteraceae bacterium]|nr:hypothetical protein [Solirubrobacteraceae bacterium]